MKLQFDTRLAAGYQSASQIARVLTENWLAENVYCPSCGCKPINKAANNRPVQDFLCPVCQEQFELKSKQAKSAGTKIADGAYQTMMERIQADDNPNFFFLSYRKADYSVQQLMLVPKHFMTAEMIIRRKPLPATAKRAGWVGCTIDLSRLPESGKILLVRQQQVVEPEEVHKQWQASLFLAVCRRTAPAPRRLPLPLAAPRLPAPAESAAAITPLTQPLPTANSFSGSLSGSPTRAKLFDRLD